jgi:molybdate transport system ATP-binding protein
VTAADAAGGTAEVAVGTGKLQVSLRDVRPGARVRVQLLARDIILATQPVEHLSVRNALRGTVTDITPEDAAGVLVRVDVGGPVLLARITAGARQALQLAPGDAVWALVKAVSTRGHAFRLCGAPPPRA